MTTTKKAFLAAAFLASFLRPAASYAFGAIDKGTSGAQFLKIAPGARPSAMGEAFAGVADDVHAIYYNPAGLGDLKKVEVTGMHDSYFQGINYEFAALSVPILSWVDKKQATNTYGVLGGAIYSLSVGNIERRSTTETDAAVNTFASNDFAYALSYGYAVPNTGLSLGATAKFIDSNLDTSHSSSFASDLGGLYHLGRLGAGFGVRNVGTQQKFSGTADPLPVTLFAGLGYKVSDHFLGSFELDAPRDNNANFAFGAEYSHTFADKISGALRAGYNTRNTDAGGFSGTSFGAGVSYANFAFDFAFVPFGDLGNTFKYSLVVKF